MGKHLKSALCLFGFLLTGCLFSCGPSAPTETTDKDTRPNEVFRGDLFRSAMDCWYKNDDQRLEEWYDTHDFTIYTTLYIDDEGVSASSSVLMHSAKNHYTYLGFHRSQYTECCVHDDASFYAPYSEEIVWTDPNTQIEKTYKYAYGFCSENATIQTDKYFNMFKYALSQYSDMDPFYAENRADLIRSGTTFGDEAIVTLQNYYSLYSLFDFATPEGYSVDGGYFVTNPNPRIGDSYHYKKEGNRTTVSFGVRDYHIGGFPENHNLTEVRFGFEGDLPLSFTRHVTYKAGGNMYNMPDGYDIDVRFSYGSLPESPFTLVGKNFSYEDETHLLEWTENSAPRYPDGHFKVDIEEVIDQVYPKDFTELDEYGSCEVEAVDFGDCYNLKFKSESKVLKDNKYNTFYTIKDGVAKAVRCMYSRGDYFGFPRTLHYRLDGGETREAPLLSLGKNVMKTTEPISEIYIPGTVEHVEKDAFAGLDENTTIYVEWVEKPVGWEEGWCPDYARIEYGASLPSQFQARTATQTQTNLLLFSDQTVYGVKRKSGGYSYFKSPIIPKTNGYDLSDILLANVELVHRGLGLSANIRFQNRASVTRFNDEFAILPKQVGEDIYFSFRTDVEDRTLERSSICFGKMTLLDERGNETTVCAEYAFHKLKKDLVVHLPSKFGQKRMAAIRFYDLTVLSTKTSSVIYGIE